MDAMTTQPSTRARVRETEAKESARDRNELQTLRRGLEALAYLNKCGTGTQSGLARHLNVPRSTAYRLLRTLMNEGYCLRIPNSRLFMVSPCVRQLSSGLGEGEVLTSVAAPIIQALGSKVRWPVAMATPDGADMLVRLTTDASTSLALAKINPGFRTPLLLTTTGVLCLAFMPEDEQSERIAAALQGRDIKQFFHNREQLEQYLRECRSQGYLVLDTRYAEGSIGLPLMRRGRPVGGLVMRYIKSALPRARVIEEYLPLLREAAAQIMADYALCEAAPCPVRDCQARADFG